MEGREGGRKEGLLRGDLYHPSMWQMLLSYFKDEETDSERLCNQPKVPRQARRGDGAQSRHRDSKSHPLPSTPR